MEVDMGKAHWYVVKHHLSISKCKHHFWRLPKRMICDSEVTLFDLTMRNGSSRKLLRKNVDGGYCMWSMLVTILRCSCQLWPFLSSTLHICWLNYISKYHNDLVNTKLSPTPRWRVATHLEYPPSTYMILEPFYIPFSKSRSEVEDNLTKSYSESYTV